MNLRSPSQHRVGGIPSFFERMQSHQRKRWWLFFCNDADSCRDAPERITVDLVATHCSMINRMPSTTVIDSRLMQRKKFSENHPLIRACNQACWIAVLSRDAAMLNTSARPRLQCSKCMTCSSWKRSHPAGQQPLHQAKNFAEKMPLIKDQEVSRHGLENDISENRDM